MAKKRMSSTQITDSDEFISLTSQQQALYFRLNSHADDDGFNNQVRTDMLMSHADEKDLKELVDKKFIFKFDNVILIKHWRIANVIRKDRYTPSVYQEYLEKVNIKDNEAYTLSPITKKEKVDESLPDDLNKALIDFEKMRNKIKKPLTERARKMIINKLQKLSGGDTNIQIEILNQSIVHCWQDVYEIKDNKNQKQIATKPDYKNIAGGFVNK